MSTIRTDVFEAVEQVIANHYANLCRAQDREAFRMYLGYSMPSLNSRSLNTYVAQIRNGKRRITPNLGRILDKYLGSDYYDIQVQSYRHVYEQLQYAAEFMQNAND